MADEDPTISHPTVPAGEPGEGSTWISDEIVAKVAGNAAREVPGVHALADAVRSRGLMRAAARRAGRADVAVEGEEATVSLRLVVLDGVAIPSVVDAVRGRVVDRVQHVTGLRVRRVDIGVVDVVSPPEPAPEEEGSEPSPSAADATPPEGGGAAPGDQPESR